MTEACRRGRTGLGACTLVYKIYTLLRTVNVGAWQTDSEMQNRKCTWIHAKAYTLDVTVEERDGQSQSVCLQFLVEGD